MLTSLLLSQYSFSCFIVFLNNCLKLTPPMHAYSEVQYCVTLCNPMDYSRPDSSVHGIFPGKNIGLGCHFLLQRIFKTQRSNSRSQDPQDQTRTTSPMSPALTGRYFTTEPPKKPPPKSSHPSLFVGRTEGTKHTHQTEMASSDRKARQAVPHNHVSIYYMVTYSQGGIGRTMTRRL